MGESYSYNEDRGNEIYTDERSHFLYGSITNAIARARDDTARRFEQVTPSILALRAEYYMACLSFWEIFERVCHQCRARKNAVENFVLNLSRIVSVAVRNRARKKIAPLPE